MGLLQLASLQKKERKGQTWYAPPELFPNLEGEIKSESLARFDQRVVSRYLPKAGVAISKLEFINVPLHNREGMGHYLKFKYHVADRVIELRDSLNGKFDWFSTNHALRLAAAVDRWKGVDPLSPPWTLITVRVTRQGEV